MKYSIGLNNETLERFEIAQAFVLPTATIGKRNEAEQPEKVQTIKTAYFSSLTVLFAKKINAKEGSHMCFLKTQKKRTPREG